MSFKKLAFFALVSVASAAVYDIQVGLAGGKLEYSPEAIGASPGDQVVFHFNPKNHTVTQSSFADPCGRKDGGFDSGFQPVAANQTDNLPTYTVTVNDTQPIWIYCRQAAGTAASHCGQGMVFAINCGQEGADNSFTNFKNSALAVGDRLKSTTAAYGDYTIPAEPPATLVTQTISLETAVWTTTYSSYPGSPQATPATLTGNVHTVHVGGPNASLIFDPSHLDNVQPRDVVMFVFHQKNHTVTQSSFADPCRKLDANGTVGFDSGFMPVTDDQTSNFPTWNITVNDTTPIWAYCRQKTPKSHCGAGMVFAINSVEDSARNFTAFQNVAKALNGSVVADTATPSSTGAPGASDGAVTVRLNGLSVTLAAIVAAFLL